MAIEMHRPVYAGARLRPFLPLAILGLLILCLLLGLWLYHLIPTVWGRSGTASSVEKARMTVPDVLTKPLPVKPVVAVMPPTNGATPPVQQASVLGGLVETVNPLKDMPSMAPPRSSPPPQPRQAQPAPPAPAPVSQMPPLPPLPPDAPPEMLARQRAAEEPRKGKQTWGLLAQPTQVAHAEGGRPVQPKSAAASSLISPAIWAVPEQPAKTLYMSMELPVELLTNLNSDIPGNLKFRLTVPIFDKFHQGVLILDKNSLIIAKQERVPVQGQSRVPLKLHQIELPTGEIIALKAVVGEQEGATGLPAKVNNHYFKLALATGISAVLNIGGRLAAGGTDNFHYSPEQEIIRDVGQSVQQDANQIVRQQLRIPPTLTIKAGLFGVILLEENVQFNKPPLVVK